MLNAFFPSFGMLFVTLKLAVKDIFLLLFIYFIIITGLVIACNLIFGGNDSNFKSIDETLVTLLEFVKKIYFKIE